MWHIVCYGRRTVTMREFITADDRERAQALLQPGEKLLWCGKYEPSGLNPVVVFEYGFAFCWNAFILTCFYLVVTAPEVNVTLLLFMIPFFLAGGMMIRFLVLHWWHRRRWLYAISTRRVLLLLHNEVREYELQPDMVMDAYLPENAPGDLIFSVQGRERYGILRCRRADEALKILDSLLGGRA